MATAHLIAHVRRLGPGAADHVVSKAELHAALLAYVDERSRIYAAYKQLPAGSAESKAFKAEHGGFMRGRESYPTIISAARKEIGEADPLHEHFGCKPLTDEVKAAYMVKARAWIAKGPYEHDEGELKQMWSWTHKVIAGKEQCTADMLSVAVMIATGARHVEVMSGEYMWVKTNTLKLRHQHCRKGRPFAVAARGDAVLLKKTRDVRLILASADDVLAAIDRVRATAGGPAGCKQRASNAICSRRTGKSKHPLLLSFIDGFKAWFVGRNGSLHIFRALYDATAIAAGEEDSVRASAERMGHEEPAYHCAEGYRSIIIRRGIDFNADDDADADSDADAEAESQQGSGSDSMTARRGEGEPASEPNEAPAAEADSAVDDSAPPGPAPVRETADGGERAAKRRRIAATLAGLDGSIAFERGQLRALLAARALIAELVCDATVILVAASQTASESG